MSCFVLLQGCSIMNFVYEFLHSFKLFLGSTCYYIKRVYMLICYHFDSIISSLHLGYFPNKNELRDRHDLLYNWVNSWQGNVDTNSLLALFVINPISCDYDKQNNPRECLESNFRRFKNWLYKFDLFSTLYRCKLR